MAKLFLAVLTVLSVTVFGLANNEIEPIFVNIFKNLHQEPVNLLTARAKVKVKTEWIEQKLDHFNENETRTWQMRFMSNDEFYKPGGPLFIFVGGEWTISPYAITSGHIYDMAKEHSGYLFYTEHRFYGESMPFNNSMNEDLQYLDIEQALADLAHFIRTMKATIDGMENSKTILTGGSYSATMATWFKKLYPDLVSGCWASSAPLQAILDYFEYKEIMAESIILMSGNACHDRIQGGLGELESMFANERGAEVKELLQLCDTFDENNTLDVNLLFYQISEIFATLVQTHSNDNIQKSCRRIMEGSTDLIGVTDYIVEKFGEKGCNNMSYSLYISLLRDTSLKGNPLRAWTYQTCNEFGWFQTSTSPHQPFGTLYPLDFFITTCIDAYGDKFTNEYTLKGIERTNKKFGELQPEVENVYWTHGQLDPWRGAGIQDESQATIIPYHAHCKDLGSITDRDTPDLKASKEKVAALVRKWLTE